MIYRFGNYELDEQRRELHCQGLPVAIEPKVFEVLMYLLQHRERVVSKEELLEHCWPGTFVSDAALSRCLAKVRRAVQPDQAATPVIKTLYGRGYCFVATITTAAQEQPWPITPAAGDHVPVPSERSKILIVDDEPFNVDYLEQELEDLGYETVSASNGQEALEKVATEAPDLILLDVMMPLMDGFTVCRILKEHETDTAHSHYYHDGAGRQGRSYQRHQGRGRRFSHQTRTRGGTPGAYRDGIKTQAHG